MYLAGFGNHHQSEAIPGALPKHQNSPQQCNFGLYSEQISGTAFTRPRHNNLFSWVYRILPSVMLQEYKPYKKRIASKFITTPPIPIRWSPIPKLKASQDFIDGLFHIAGNQLVNAYLYQCNKTMDTRFFTNHDGEMLFVPYMGSIRIHTELGKLDCAPGMIAVIPRGIKFKVELLEKIAEGYLCENQANPLTLPQLGPIGANGLANPRHFLYPKAAFEETNQTIEIICKHQGNFWLAKSQNSPLNVVAWHGNYAPYCYDLSLFNTINTVSFDHPDPSIFTVLTSESSVPGIANLDFVIFPERWMVAEHTFRPPYFHRNIMSELMGLIKGEYDAKNNEFSAGGISIHNEMTAHGPDAINYRAASQNSLQPEYYENTLAFMFESCQSWNVTTKAFKHPSRQKNYMDCWQGLQKKFPNPD